MAIDLITLKDQYCVWIRAIPWRPSALMLSEKVVVVVVLFPAQPYKHYKNQCMIYKNKWLCWRSPQKLVAHHAGGCDISNKCCFAASAWDRPGPDNLWSMRKVWLTFQELSLWDICISEQMIHCNLFSHIYKYLHMFAYKQTYMCLYMPGM